MRILARMAEYLLSSLPNRCLLCHQSVKPPLTGVCQHCLTACAYVEPICLGCGTKMPLLQCYCGTCMKFEPLKVVSPCSYHSLFGPLIAGLKFRQQFAIVPPLTKALCERLAYLVSEDIIVLPQVIVPVPLHLNRLKSRGFNQAWVIAQDISRQTGLTIEGEYLRREFDTTPQAGLSGVERRKNLADAFVLEPNFPYQRIALIDDVVTTGTTVAEIVKLFQHQHVDVQVWCLARAEAPNL